MSGQPIALSLLLAWRHCFEGRANLVTGDQHLSLFTFGCSYCLFGYHPSLPQIYKSSYASLTVLLSVGLEG